MQRCCYQLAHVAVISHHFNSRMVRHPEACSPSHTPCLSISSALCGVLQATGVVLGADEVLNSRIYAALCAMAGSRASRLSDDLAMVCCPPAAHHAAVSLLRSSSPALLCAWSYTIVAVVEAELAPSSFQAVKASCLLGE